VCYGDSVACTDAPSHQLEDGVFIEIGQQLDESVPANRSIVKIIKEMLETEGRHRLRGLQQACFFVG